MRRWLSTMIVVLPVTVILFGLAACSDDSRKLTIHEPGEYKGTTDPLLAAGEHPGLNHRFMQVQRDR